MGPVGRAVRAVETRWDAGAWEGCVASRDRGRVGSRLGYLYLYLYFGSTKTATRAHRRGHPRGEFVPGKTPHPDLDARTHANNEASGQLLGGRKVNEGGQQAVWANVRHMGVGWREDVLSGAGVRK